MTPVDQTTLGYPGGNCFSACVASLLDLQIEDVPYFMGSDQWWQKFETWLLSRGYWAVSVPIDDEWFPPGLHILNGWTARGSLHSVVARGQEIIHDPHPARPGIVRRERTVALIPLDSRKL